MADWNEAQTAEMLRLHGLGWSGRAIGEALGVSKNAVNTKRHRMGLSRPAKDRDLREARKLSERVRCGSFDFRRSSAPRDSGPKGPLHFDLDDTTRSDGLRITDDGFGGCRWPIGGEGADTRFCCRETPETYCAQHAKRAFTRPASPEELRDLRRLFMRAA